MNYLEKLLDGAEVEWKPLWEVTTWGGKFNAVENYKQPKVNKYHCFMRKEIKPLVVEGGNVKILTANISDLYTTEDLAGDKIAQGEVVGIPSGGKPVVHYYKGRFIVSNNHLATSNDTSYLDNKYLYYFMLSEIELIKSFYRGSGIKHPSMLAVLEMQIPIPPLIVQKEIVRILDAFTSLTAELTTELTMRKKQYNYYREQLLSFDEGVVDWKPLREVAQYSRMRISHDQLDETNYVGVATLLQNRAGKEKSSHVATAGNLTEYREGDILIGNIRPYLKKIWHADRAGGTNGDVLVVRITGKSVNSRYLYQVLSDDKFFEYNMQHAKGAIKPCGNKPKIMEYSVPIPLLAEQARIVSVLDKFDARTNSIQEGLPREIELRQKQYEYYRDMLLNFQ